MDSSPLALDLSKRISFSPRATGIGFGAGECREKEAVSHLLAMRRCLGDFRDPHFQLSDGDDFGYCGTRASHRRWQSHVDSASYRGRSVASEPFDLG